MTSEKKEASEALYNIHTHYTPWRRALELARDYTNATLTLEEDEAESSYWAHELEAFDRTYKFLQGVFPINAPDAASLARIGDSVQSAAHPNPHMYIAYCVKRGVDDLGIGEVEKLLWAAHSLALSSQKLALQDVVRKSMLNDNAVADRQATDILRTRAEEAEQEAYDSRRKITELREKVELLETANEDATILLRQVHQNMANRTSAMFLIPSLSPSDLNLIAVIAAEQLVAEAVVKPEIAKRLYKIGIIAETRAAGYIFYSLTDVGLLIAAHAQIVTEVKAA